MQIFVMLLDGETLTLADAAFTVDDVKREIEEVVGIPAELQRLIFEGKELEDGRELTDYKIRNESTIHLTMDLDGGGHVAPDLHFLASKHLLHKKICRKCYGRLPPQATRCRKAKCGRTSNIRPKKMWYRRQFEMFNKKNSYDYLQI